MAYAAIAAIIGTAVSVGTGIYGASQQQGFNGLTPQKISQNDVTKLNLGDPNQGLLQYMNQQSYIPQLQGIVNELNTSGNKAWQQQLSALDPNLMNSISTLGQNTLQQLQGQIPQDVQDQIGRDTAYQALQGGFAGTGMSRNLTARDLGLTSLNQQQTGVNSLGGLLGDLTSLNPNNANVANLLFSPQQLLQRQDNQTQYNTDLANQIAFYNKGAQNAGQMGAALGANAQNQSLAGIGNQLSSLFNNKSVQGLFGNSSANIGTSSTLSAPTNLRVDDSGSGSTSSGDTSSGLTSTDFSNISSDDLASLNSAQFNDLWG